ncbi:MAG: phosphotransferase [Chloroflexota bacterium]
MTNQVFDTDIVANAVSTHYDIGNLTRCDLLRVGFNYNYLIETSDQKYVLRIYLNGKYYIRDADDFRFELELLNFLLAQGLPVVKPIGNRVGQQLTSHQFANETRHMALFAFAPGVELDKASADGHLTDDHVKQVGEIAALIHQTTDPFQSRYHRYHLNTSTYLLDKSLQIFARYLAERNLGDLAFFTPFANQIREHVEVLGQTAPVYGLIHADMHGNNIFLDPEAGMTILDFDHCAYGWRAYEFAVWSGNAEVLATLLEGYESVRKLSDLERQLIPTFATLHSIWDMGDILYYNPLWGETVSNESLERNLTHLRNLVQSKL